MYAADVADQLNRVSLNCFAIFFNFHKEDPHIIITKEEVL